MTTHEISMIITDACPEGNDLENFNNCVGCEHFCGVLRGRNRDNEVIYKVDCGNPKNKKHKTQ